MQAIGVPVLPFVIVNRDDIEHDRAAVVAAVESELTYPVFVKPANLGSSVGISRARDLAELHSALEECSPLGPAHRRRARNRMAREIEVSVLGNDDPIVSSMAGEIVPRRDFYDYKAKYVTDDSELHIPAPITS